MIKVQLIITDADIEIARVTAICSERSGITAALNRIVGSEPIQSSPKTGTFAPVTFHIDAKRPYPTPHALARGEAKRGARTPEPVRSKRVSIARRNMSYTTPNQEMRQRPELIEAHTNLLDFISKLPKDMVGLDFVRQDLHRVWWGWYDGTIVPVVVESVLAKQSLTVRLWLAEWLMVRLEHYDFAGRIARERVRNAHAALRADRINKKQFDEKMLLATMALAKLEASGKR